MKKMVIIFLLIFSSIVYGYRDLFKLDNHCMFKDPLVNTLLADFTFVGSIIGLNQRFGFIEDTLGHVYQITLGQKIGGQGELVINILQDQILLSDGKSYSLIK